MYALMNQWVSLQAPAVQQMMTQWVTQLNPSLGQGATPWPFHYMAAGQSSTVTDSNPPSALLMQAAGQAYQAEQLLLHLQMQQTAAAIPAAPEPIPAVDYTPEVRDEAMTVQWKKDDKYVKEYQKVQAETTSGSTAASSSRPAQSEATPSSGATRTTEPKPKRMPIKMEQLAWVDVPTGKLEFFARLVPTAGKPQEKDQEQRQAEPEQTRKPQEKDQEQRKAEPEQPRKKEEPKPTGQPRTGERHPQETTQPDQEPQSKASKPLPKERPKLKIAQKIVKPHGTNEEDVREKDSPSAGMGPKKPQDSSSSRPSAKPAGRRGKASSAGRGNRSSFRCCLGSLYFLFLILLSFDYICISLD